MNYDPNIVKIDEKKLMDKIYETLDNIPTSIGTFARKVGVPMEYIEPIMQRLAYAYKIEETPTPRTYHMAYSIMTNEMLEKKIKFNQAIANNEDMKRSVHLGEFERKVERIKKEINRRNNGP